jgi:Ca2+-transporting ATPase
MRDGVLILLPRSELVVGDIIKIEAGEEMPADGEVLVAVECKVNQSKFTGEPDEVIKVPVSSPIYGELAEGATYKPEQILKGSPVTHGWAEAQITAVGESTEFGGAIKAATELTDEYTPLQKQLARLSKVIAIIGISLSVLLFASLVWQRYSAGTLDATAIFAIFMVAVTLIVVTVPEGLPMSVTLCLACSMRKMARNNCLIRKLHAAETIGCATVICTDKTGTLTMNQMRLDKLFVPAAASEMIFEAIAVNSSADLNTDNGEVKVIGNPTEGALLLYLNSQNIDYKELRAGSKVEHQWSFTTETKYMATLLVSGRFYLKGAPEVVLGKCKNILADGSGEVLEMSGEMRDAAIAALR